MGSPGPTFLVRGYLELLGRPSTNMQEACLAPRLLDLIPFGNRAMHPYNISEVLAWHKPVDVCVHVPPCYVSIYCIM